MISKKMLFQFAKSIPLVGPLWDTNRKDHKEATAEVGISIVLSTTPIWLGSLLLLADSSSQSTFLDHVQNSIKDGDVLLICSALISPLFYFLFVEGKNLPSFPAARSLMFSVAIVLLVSAGVFAFQKGAAQFADEFRVDKEFIFGVSAVTFALAVLVTYLATCYRNWRGKGAAAYQKSDTADFVDLFNRETE